MKKALVFVLAVMMVMAMAVPASAATNSPTAPTNNETTTAPMPVVVESKDDTAATVAFVPVEDVVKTLPEEAKEVVVEAQKSLAEAAPAGMKTQYFCYVTVEKKDETKDEPASITLKIEKVEKVVVKQFVDGKWVELEVVVNPDGTITVNGVVDGPIAIFTK